MEVIQKIIEQKIRPALNAHHGDLELIQVTEDGYLKVRLTGACSSCPGSQQTLKEFVEALIMAECPEIKGVIPEYGVSDELIAEALKRLRRQKIC
ncbi:NifU family protein [Desulfitobacterium sp. Sab5]|uniref:NifU family protein n=1 Tax=Desulfitobacterium nosdiversum TaxID=3375356 RepID=UPI003CF6487C